MERISLRERLSHMEPERNEAPMLLDCMTLRTYINVIKFLIPKRRDVLARLIRCGGDGQRLDMTLAEIINDASRADTPENAELVFDLLVRPFEAMAKEAKHHE